MKKSNRYTQMPLAKLGGARYAKKQKGMMILEAMVAIVIFALGIIGILGLGARAIASQSDAQYRADATKFANQIIQTMDVGVDRTNKATLRTSLNAYGYRDNDPSDTDCNFSGNPAAAGSPVETWVEKVISNGSGLPGAKAEGLRITVATNPTTDLNQVQVTICWKTPDSDAWRQHSMIGYIN